MSTEKHVAYLSSLRALKRAEAAQLQQFEAKRASAYSSYLVTSHKYWQRWHDHVQMTADVLTVLRVGVEAAVVAYDEHGAALQRIGKSMLGALRGAHVEGRCGGSRHGGVHSWD